MSSSYYAYYEDSSSDDSHYGHQNYHLVDHHPSHHVSHHGSHRSHGHPRSNHHVAHQSKSCRRRQSVHRRARSPSPPPRTRSPTPAAKPKRCKNRRARSPSPPARRYGTREAYRDPKGYTSVAAGLANLKLDNQDSDSDEPGVHSRYRRGRGSTTRAECEAYSRLQAHGGRAPLPRPAVWAYNPRARSPPPNIRMRQDSDDLPLPRKSNFYDDDSD